MQAYDYPVVNGESRNIREIPYPIQSSNEYTGGRLVMSDGSLGPMPPFGTVENGRGYKGFTPSQQRSYDRQKELGMDAVGYAAGEGLAGAASYLGGKLLNYGRGVYSARKASKRAAQFANALDELQPVVQSRKYKPVRRLSEQYKGDRRLKKTYDWANEKGQEAMDWALREPQFAEYVKRKSGDRIGAVSEMLRPGFAEDLAGAPVREYLPTKYAARIRHLPREVADARITQMYRQDPFFRQYYKKGAERVARNERFIREEESASLNRAFDKARKEAEKKARAKWWAQYKDANYIGPELGYKETMKKVVPNPGRIPDLIRSEEFNPIHGTDFFGNTFNKQLAPVNGWRFR